VAADDFYAPDLSKEDWSFKMTDEAGFTMRLPECEICGGEADWLGG
jgi:hypothetical protein